MRLEEIQIGRKFSIYALVFDGGLEEDCPAREFLEDLKRTNERSHKRFLYLLDRLANVGQITNKQFSNPLKEGINELKTEYTDRILYFFHTGSRVILSHGFQKKRNYQSEIRKAIAYRRQWEESL